MIKKSIKLSIILASIFMVGGLASCSNFASSSDNTNTSGAIKSSTFVRTDDQVIIHESETINIIATGTATNVTTADVVDVVGNSVVEITTETVTTGSFMQQYVSSGAGSGVIVNEDGYIITNHHVIEGASTIMVNLRSGDTYNAALVGSDEMNDIAVIKIDPGTDELTYAVVGDPSKLKVGSDVIAIGNPLGSLGGSVTKGIISALNREVTIDNMPMTLLQTDTAVNPGNSGGGLFNMNGELIGIVNAKSTGEDIDGIGFAIPIDVAIDTFEDLVQYGYVKGRASLGMTVVAITDSFNLHYYGLTYKGLYVSTIDNDNAKEFQNKDYIMSIDGKSVSTVAQLNAIIKNHEVGDKIKVVIYRNNLQKTISLTLIEATPSID